MIPKLPTPEQDPRPQAARPEPGSRDSHSPLQLWSTPHLLRLPGEDAESGTLPVPGALKHPLDSISVL